MKGAAKVLCFIVKFSITKVTVVLLSHLTSHMTFKFVVFLSLCHAEFCESGQIIGCLINI